MSPDEARLEMVHELHTVIYGDSWARPETPKQVWEELLAKVRQLKNQAALGQVDQ